MSPTRVHPPPGPSSLPLVPGFRAGVGVPMAGPIMAAEAGSGQERGREHVVTADLLCAVGAGEDSGEQHFPEVVLEKGSPEKL